MNLNCKIYSEKKRILLDLDFEEEFNTPNYTIDILDEDEKEAEIKEIYNLNEIENVGIILYAIPIKKNMAWAKRQKYIFYLREKESPSEQAKQLLKLPTNHYIQVDLANNKMRLCGLFVKKNTNYGEWIYY